MSIYDPPDPPEPRYVCRYCDGEMVEEWPGVRGSECVCTNPECEHSNCYKPPEAVEEEEGEG